MLYVNPKVLEQADAMDKPFKRGAKLKALQCIPVGLKDNIDTADMPGAGHFGPSITRQYAIRIFLVGRTHSRSHAFHQASEPSRQTLSEGERSPNGSPMGICGYLSENRRQQSY